MARTKIPKEILKILKSITNKRAQIVIEHIIKHGRIKTEELEKDYGYNHPPRAARDVREFGIPLETIRIKSKDGRNIAAYTFGDFSKIKNGRLAGRKVFSKEFKTKLFKECRGKCAICDSIFEERYLQIDHRVPYEISGDIEDFERNIKEYMLLCGSCNRAKSWSCEHCSNWCDTKLSKICNSCYWAEPLNYSHIALKEIRRTDIQWEGKEVKIYDKLKEKAKKEDNSIPSYVKHLVEKLL